MRSPLLYAALLACAAEISQAAESAVTPQSDVYLQHCAMCHEGAVPHAPHSLQFALMGPQAVLAAISTGVMREQASQLSDEQKRALAEELGGARLDIAAAVESMPHCDAARARFDRDRPPAGDGWGFTRRNERRADAATAGLSAAEVPRLKLKWAFGFPGATRVHSQPAVAGGALIFGSQSGTVYAIDMETACLRWSFQAAAEMRNTPYVENWAKGDEKADPRLFFGDRDGNVYALEAFSGRELWRVRGDPHPRVTITGSPRLFENRLYVPLSSSEWLAAADPGYGCCTFRGGVAVLDATDGRLVQRYYSIAAEPVPTGATNPTGAARYAPAGAPVWNSPTIDPVRRRLYVGTGEAYTSPAPATSDAVLAFDLDSGRMLWHYQSIENDAWNMACFIGGGPNCPSEDGPDFDIGAPPILARLPNGHELLLVGQKSAHVFALDPEDGGLIWRDRYGRGGVDGGMHWGMAYDGHSLYVPMTDTPMTGKEVGPAMPGLYALDPATGKKRWFTPNPDVCPEALKPQCDPGLSPPIMVMPGIVFSGAYDGRLRAHDSANGRLVWEFDTVRAFDTANGVAAHGGSIESVGPIVVDGYLIASSGYAYGSRMGGNVLLAFTVDGE